MNGTQPDLQRTIKATAIVFGLLPQLAGLVVGLSAIAYVIGWGEQSTFYSTLGVPWVTSMVTPTEFMQSNVWTVNSIGGFFLLSVFLLSQEMASELSLRRVAISTLGVSGICFISALLTQPRIERIFAFGMIFLLSINLGVSIGELVAGLARSRLKWTKHHLYIMLFVATSGLFLISNVPGLINAKEIIDTHATLLPRVNMKVNQSVEWRLVSIVDGRMLLISFDKKSANHIFALVAPADVANINTLPK